MSKVHLETKPKMASKQSRSKEQTLKGMTSGPGLKFWIFIPIIMLLLLLVLALISSNQIATWATPQWLAISAVSLLGVVGLALLITRRIAQRIERIIQAAEQVAQGDFGIQIDDLHHDEIGRLVQSFNKMVTNLDELHQTRELLSRTMSPAVRQLLIERGLDFRGIPQMVSVLFVDMWGFTRITERYNAEQLIFFLNDYYTTIANQVHIGDGIIGKYGGDSILAYFGALDPEPPSKTASSALLTALALQDAIEIMSERWNYLGLPPIRVGVGITIGSVMAGPIGSEQQFEYTVIGDAVNLASRLQDLTRNVEGYSIMISAELYEVLDKTVKNQIQVVSAEFYERLSEKERARLPVYLVDLGEVLVKGKAGPVQVYAIPDPGR